MDNTAKTARKKMTNAPTYRIKDWKDRYECNRTREMIHMKWVPVPVKHDGLGYNTLVNRANGAAYLGAWLAILQVAAKCDPRGTLLRDSRTPLRAADIAMMTRLPEGIIAETLALCCHPAIGWLETIINEANPQEPAEKPQEGAVYLPLQGITGNDITGNNTPLPPKGDGAGKRKEKKPRDRNPVIDALAECDGPLSEMNGSAWSRVAKAMAEIHEVSPDVTPEEIRRRAANYKTHMRDALLTATALAKHWAKCGAAAEESTPTRKPAINVWHSKDPNDKETGENRFVKRVRPDGRVMSLNDLEREAQENANATK
jgi:hypothetical protein